jgi:hypothetical protein
MKSIFNGWLSTKLIIAFSNPTESFNIHFTEPATFQHFKTRYIKKLYIAGIEINKSKIIMSAIHNSEYKNIVITPDKWPTFFGLLKNEQIAPISVLNNPPLPTLQGKSALVVIKEFKKWLTLQQQEEKLQKINFNCVAESEPHLINENTEFRNKLISHKGGKLALFKNEEYQLYCWAKYLFYTQEISYKKACYEAVERFGSFTGDDQITEYAESLRADITKKYDNQNGLNQITGIDFPPNNFF